MSFTTNDTEARPAFLYLQDGPCLCGSTVGFVQVTNHKGPLGSTPIDFLKHLTDVTLTLMGGFHILNTAIICYRGG